MAAEEVGRRPMATILVLGTVAEDVVVRLGAPLKVGSHQEGEEWGARLGGGAANTGVALARAGHRALAVSAVGGNAAGDRLLAELAANGVDVSLVRRLPGASSRAVILTDGTGERTIVNLKRVIEAEPPTRLLDVAADCLYVRSRAPGLAELMRRKAAGCPVVAHVPPCLPGSLPAHVLVGSASDLDAGFLACPFTGGRAVAGDLLRWVVVTRGAAGATAYGTDGEVNIPARAVRAVDTTGAGDAFAAGLIHGLVRGLPMEKAVATGVAWGTAKTLYEGSIPGPDFPPPDPA
jgi:sugar/nucleoside kinase (ribokinase family)